MGRGPTPTYYQSMNASYVEGTLTCLKPEVIKDRITPEFPLVLNIEPTNACNLKCFCCPRERMIAAQGVNHLPFETFRRIIDEASGYPRLIMLNLHKDGEPLLHKKLPEMIAYAKARDVAETIHLNTNGTLLGTDAGHRLLEAGIDDVTISVDAARSDTWTRIKGSDDFHTLVQNIHAFIALRDRISAPTHIRVKIMEFEGVSVEEINEFRRQWETVADEVQVTGVHDWSGAIKGLSITDETSVRRYPCALLWYTLAVNSNGKVSVCNVDWNYSGVVGHVDAHSLHHIWNGTTIRRIRRAHLESQFTDPEVCERCVVWTSVGDIHDHLSKRTEFL